MRLSMDSSECSDENRRKLHFKDLKDEWKYSTNENMKFFEV